jgi:hypothetical protein
MPSKRARRRYYEKNYQDILARNARQRAVYRERDRATKRTSMLRRRYGITQADYEAMLRAQGGACAICRATSSNNGREETYFDVDHDHVTKRVRGLLCRHCNVLLGSLEKDAALLEAAKAYLAAHSAVITTEDAEPQRVLPFLRRA